MVDPGIINWRRLYENGTKSHRHDFRSLPVKILVLRSDYMRPVRIQTNTKVKISEVFI